LEAVEYSGAALVTERNTLPSISPVAAVGGPTNVPSTNAPVGAETDITFGTPDSRAA